MNIKNKLNLVELASEMAETMLKNVTEQNGYKESDIIEYLDKDEFGCYTDEAQDLFNKYYDEVYEFLEKLPNVLVKGGRVAILSFHSGEDRLVKKSFKGLLREGVYSKISTEVIRPSIEECNMNSRARSAKMRWAIKA